MSYNLKDVIENTKTLSLTDSALNTLMDFERVIDELDLYTFANWKSGELVEGPIYEKYFVTCTFMYDYKNMPDPAGGERLLNYGCEITYKKDILEYPIAVKSYDDFKPGTKMPRMVSKPIWLVTITMPKQLMSDIEQGSIELENGLLDQEDIEQAAEEGRTDDVFQQDMEQQNAPAI